MEPEAGPSRPKLEVSTMFVGIGQYSISDRLLSGLVVARRYAIGAGMVGKNVCGQPWRHGKIIATGVPPTSWGAQSRASTLRSGKGLRARV